MSPGCPYAGCEVYFRVLCIVTALKKREEKGVDWSPLSAPLLAETCC